MSDGHRSGRSTGRVSCKNMELLKRCSMIEMRWNKYEVSLASPVWTHIRRPSSEMKFRVVELKTPRFSTAIGSNLYAEDRVEYFSVIIIIIIIWPRYSIPEEWKNYAMQYKKVQKSSWNEPYSSSFTKQSCSKMALYRWIRTESRWNKKLISVSSPDWSASLRRSYCYYYFLYPRYKIPGVKN